MAKVAAAMQAYQERAAYADCTERWAELEAACRELADLMDNYHRAEAELVRLRNAGGA